MEREKSWQCAVCGYVHRGSAPPATCPVCGVEAELFSEMVLVSASSETPNVATAPSSGYRCAICDYLHPGDAPPELCPVCGAEKSLFSEERAAADADRGTDFDGRILIVGAGVAGMAAAEAARETAPNARIRLVTKEPLPPLMRLNLTRYLGGEVALGDLSMKEPAWFDANRIEIVAGDVVDLGLVARRASLRDGTEIPYDRLVIAAGAHPFVPPFPGATRRGTCVLRTLADAEAILSRMKAGARAVCVGGGLLGLETAAALRRRGADVTVLEGFGWLLPRQLPKRGGELLGRAISELGVRVLHGAKVQEIAGDEEVRAVVLETGEEIPADVVVLATGVRANSYLARRAGIKVDFGIVVDDFMRTSADGVFAAGDVADHHGAVYGIWPAAFAMGRVAGTNAALGRAEMARMAPSNRIKVVGVDLFSIGVVAPGDGSAEVFDAEPEPGVFQRAVVRDGRLVGAVLYGDTRASREVKEAVETGAQIAESPELLRALPLLRSAR